jgi:Leucine-rich repeat (LRR) protein
MASAEEVDLSHIIGDPSVSNDIKQAVHECLILQKSELDISSNQMEELLDFSKMTWVKAINMNRCRTSILHKNYFPPGLLMLNMKSCNFTKLEDGHIPESVIKLNVANGEIEIMDIHLPNLLELECNSNSILTMSIKPHFPALRKLNAHSNKSVSFTDAPDTLIEVDISFNNLDTIPQFAEGVTLLDIANNNLTELKNLPNTIIKLKAYKNNIKEIDRFPDPLSYLDLSKNKLTSIPELGMGVTECDLAENEMTSLPSGAPLLEELNMSENKLKKLEGLEVFRSLVTANFSENQIEYISGFPECLKKIRLRCNNLKELPPIPRSLDFIHIGRNSFEKKPDIPITCSSVYMKDNPFNIGEESSPRGERHMRRMMGGMSREEMHMHMMHQRMIEMHMQRNAFMRASSGSAVSSIGRFSTSNSNHVELIDDEIEC